jgi:xylulokinase
LTIVPFGNGAERMLVNEITTSVISGIDFNRHNNTYVLRAAQEGIAFAFRYGIDILKENGIPRKLLRARKSNLFLSSLFRETLTTIADVKIELYNTDGALGSARGAALGTGLFKSREETFQSLTKLEEVNPNPEMKEVLEAAYARWKKEL